MNRLRLKAGTSRGRSAPARTSVTSLSAREGDAIINLRPGAKRVRGSLRGCAGLQLEFPVDEDRGVPDYWVPFEGAVAIGWD